MLTEKKLNIIHSFQKNHLLLEPTESDVRDCISKGKTQVCIKTFRF